MISSVPVGNLLREWRQRRRMSQLDLALEAEISARHLSFVETGRSQPSREMVLQLAERLDMPLRERNVLLVAAGYRAGVSRADARRSGARGGARAVDLVLKGHEPYPALAVDRHWNLVASNAAVPPLLAGADPSLLQPPINVLRLSLHPDGLAPRIANLAEWRAHLLARLRRQIEISADTVLVELLNELAALPAPLSRRPIALTDHELAGIVVPLRLVTDGGILSFISTTTVFGTPVDITLSELALEAFFPADAATAEALRRLAA